MNRSLALSLSLTFLAFGSLACEPGRSAHFGGEERGEHGATGHGERGHDEAPDPRLEEPSVIAAATRVRVLNGALECPTEVLGLVDVHEPVKSVQEGLELLRRRAALVGAEAVVGVEFEHGEGGAEKTHLSGTAVRCNDLLRGRKYDVLGKLEVTAEMEHEEEALASLKQQAKAKGANLVLDVRFDHGEGDKTKLTGTAVHAYDPRDARK